VRKIDLGLDLRLAVAAGTLFAPGASALTSQILAHPLGFIDFDGTRVRLLLGDSDLGEDVKDLFTLDFQFPRQIVDSNLTHPPFTLSRIPLRDHDNPHGKFVGPT
jgi:hypothetical protein